MKLCCELQAGSLDKLIHGTSIVRKPNPKNHGRTRKLIHVHNKQYQNYELLNKLYYVGTIYIYQKDL